MKKFLSLLFAIALIINSSGAIAQNDPRQKSKREIVVITDKEKLSAFLGLSADQEKVIFKEIDALYPLYRAQSKMRINLMEVIRLYRKDVQRAAKKRTVR